MPGTFPSRIPIQQKHWHKNRESLSSQSVKSRRHRKSVVAINLQHSQHDKESCLHIFEVG